MSGGARPGWRAPRVRRALAAPRIRIFLTNGLNSCTGVVLTCLFLRLGDDYTNIAKLYYSLTLLYLLREIVRILA